MAVEDKLVLVANPGSASRKYALFYGASLRAELHFEHEAGRIICTITAKNLQKQVPLHITDLHHAAKEVLPLLRQFDLLAQTQHIDHIGLRVVAPSSFFMQDHVLAGEALAKLESLADRAPLHIKSTLEELYSLRQDFPAAHIVGVSDSGFHATKPDFAWNYGIPLGDADQFEIKRFGYHGLSVESVVSTLQAAGKLAPKLIVAHLGSGASITAVLNGKSIDTTMGYSPLEGLIMGTRSGSIDFTAALSLQIALSLNNEQLAQYLNVHSGLLGLGGSADIRELLEASGLGNHRAGLALSTFTHAVQKAIGSMASALNGVDQLVFTGTVGERSVPIREQVASNLEYLGLTLDPALNAQTQPSLVSQAGSKPVLVVPTQESHMIARRVLALTSA